jgi:hypothetical protein
MLHKAADTNKETMRDLLAFFAPQNSTSLLRGQCWAHHLDADVVAKLSLAFPDKLLLLRLEFLVYDFDRNY